MSPSTAITSNLAAPRKGVVLAQTASLRFERLGDRIQFLILNETQEFLAEKDALISTVQAPTPAPRCTADQS